ncbi:AAA family ATPase [Metabacillus fastidiosus]|uniref:AAA family ATPase n=1 Tax=Metabacillus fastidiosus TaxID=1458 RepID=UPI002DB6D6CB|nr:SbcC/MukB-like Walker B domain-containing protein [Metabacillus fastidiosus]MEC2077562.1 AAA family ATPase [Metabacillus fastidiosus]
MKPIELTVSGLHSFREKQVIDFNALCDGGIFGIFGPTGSGKSSILDAMTLALYGKVERAANNTHGILNHAEDQLSVSFTFALENAANKKQYKVERVFKRVDELRVKTSICRLMELGEETVVLADKAGEVNEKIYSLLGLTIDDFTRAVVLPQGKFAEFLSLKGTERRQMLQRLFHLEKYGDELIRKLKKRHIDTRTEVEKLTAEQTGLGDASDEALKAAEQELFEIETLLGKRKVELDAVANEYEIKKQIWQLQLEQKSLQIEKKSLDDKKSSINELEQRLERAEKAENLRPYAEAVNIAVHEEEEAEKKFLIAKQQYSEVKEKYKQISKQYEEARMKKSAEEPKLVAYREKLLHLQEVEEHLIKDKQLKQQLEQQISELTAEKEKKQEELLKAKGMLEKAVAKQSVLKEQHRVNVIPFKEREQARAAAEAKTKISHKEQQLVETKAKAEQKAGAVTNSKLKYETLAEELAKKKELLTAQFFRIEQLYFILCEREREHEQFINRIKHQLNKWEDEEQKRKEHLLAKQLVHQLKEGSACPVCGSTEHPNPATAWEDETDGTAKIVKIKEVLEEAAAMNQQAYTVKLNLENLTAQIVNEHEFLKGVGKISEINEIEPLSLSDFETGCNVLLTEYKAISQDFLEVKEKIAEITTEMNNFNQQLNKLTHEISSASEEEKEWKKSFTVLQMEQEHLRKIYDEQFPDILFENVEQLGEEIAEKDRLAEDLSARIEKSVTFIEDHEKLVKDHEQAIMKYNEQRIELDSALSNRNMSIDEKKEKLKEIDQSQGSIEIQIHNVEQKLHEIINKEKEIYEAWQHISSDLQQQQSILAANEKTLENAKFRAVQARNKWEEIRIDAPFLSIEETIEACLNADVRLQMRKAREEFSDKMKQLQTDLARIEEKLGNQNLTEQQWYSIQNIVIETKKQLDEAREARGAAQKVCEAIKEKHARFMEIEKQKTALDASLQHLEKLQAVFKGNSFVEYIAEEQLEQVSRNASERLGLLTRQRYAIEVDSQGGFIMRDDANGGIRRPVTTLSGGETFLTSLALALSLSTEIQLRGEYPLQFFFLDEGFGTLDSELLDTVVTALEKLQSHNLSVGVISHVQELRERLPVKLIVQPSEPSGKGSTVQLELL